jgi:hypothetical protein
MSHTIQKSGTYRSLAEARTCVRALGVGDAGGREERWRGGKSGALD